MDVRVGPDRRLGTEVLIDAFELWWLWSQTLEDSGESLGLQRDQTNQSWKNSILNIHWKAWCWSWSWAPMLWPPDAKSRLIRKDPDAGKGWRQEEKGTTGWDGWKALLTQWTWVWACSGRWWSTGKPGILQSTASQRVGSQWVTKQH